MVPHKDIMTQYLQHEQYAWPRAHKKIGSTIWTSVTWAIWKFGNDRVFENIIPDPRNVIEEVKARTLLRHVILLLGLGVLIRELIGKD